MKLDNVTIVLKTLSSSSAIFVVFYHSADSSGTSNTTT